MLAAIALIVGTVAGIIIGWGCRSLYLETVHDCLPHDPESCTWDAKGAGF